MYDTIGLYLGRDVVGNIDFLKETPKYLTTVTSEGISQFGEYLTGYLGSLKISINTKRVKIGDSSLCKEYLGDNFKTLSKGDTRLAIDYISDSLHLPCNNAKVTRLDFGGNIVTQFEEAIYYPYMGELQYYKRFLAPDGLYYMNNLKQMVFYSKVIEQLGRGNFIPDIYKGRHLMRIESRFKRKLLREFNRNTITGATLSDEDFYRELVMRWRDQFLNIQKIKHQMGSIKNVTSSKQLIEELAAIQLGCIGQDKAMEMIKEWYRRGLITKKQAQDHRAKIKQLMTYNPKEERHQLIDELTTKVKQAASNW